MGDSFTVNVTGPVGAAVTVDGSFSEGTIGSSGSLTPPVTGTWDSSVIGCYNEVWAVDGVTATTGRELIAADFLHSGGAQRDTYGYLAVRGSANGQYL